MKILFLFFYLLPCCFVNGQVKEYLQTAIQLKTIDSFRIKEIQVTEPSVLSMLDSFFNYKKIDECNCYEDTAINVVLFARKAEPGIIDNNMENITDSVFFALYTLKNEKDYTTMLFKYYTQKPMVYSFYKNQLILFICSKNTILTNEKSKLNFLKMALNYLSKKTQNDIKNNPDIKVIQSGGWNNYKIKL